MRGKIMDYKNIQELIKAVSDSKLTSFEIEADGISIKMKKEEVQVKNMPVADNKIEEKVKYIDKAIDEVSLEQVVIEKKVEVKEESKVIENTIAIKSPIVGTFYNSPSPEDAPFVSVGSKVKKGDVLCIIEAMKLMNEIEAEDNYEVVEVLVGNQDMVEYGQPLFTVKKV
jgi:acetyl-CoA carboxylase biotin carboxyl carrier protein